MKTLAILALLLVLLIMIFERVSLTAELDRTREELRQAQIAVEAPKEKPRVKSSEPFNNPLDRKPEGLNLGL